MTKVLCGFYDVVSSNYLFVVAKDSESVAKRDFISDFVAGRLDAIEKVREYPNHYRVDVLAHFNSQTGEIENVQPYTLLNLSSCIDAEGKKELIEV